MDLINDSIISIFNNINNVTESITYNVIKFIQNDNVLFQSPLWIIIFFLINFINLFVYV